MTSLLLVVLFSCGVDVEWQQQNAKWKGEIYAVPGVMTLKCCDPGENCAKREVTTTYTNTTLRSYQQNDDLAGYFRNENWQMLFPELRDYPDIVDSIILKNPKSSFATDTSGFIIYDRNTNINDTSAIFFAFYNTAKAWDPCAGKK